MTERRWGQGDSNGVHWSPLEGTFHEGSLLDSEGFGREGSVYYLLELKEAIGHDEAGSNLGMHKKEPAQGQVGRA